MRIFWIGGLASIIASLAIASANAASERVAAETKRLTYIKKLELDIRYRTAEGNWCAEQTELYLTATSKHVLTSKRFLNFQFAEVARRLHQKCPSLRKVAIKGYTTKNPDRLITAGTYSLNNEWRFVARNPIDGKNFTEQSTIESQPSKSRHGKGDLVLSERRELQVLLKFLNYPVGNTSGKIEPETIKSVSKFALDWGLNEQSYTNRDVLNALRLAAKPDLEIFGKQETLEVASSGAPQNSNTVEPANAPAASIRSYADANADRIFPLHREIAFRTVFQNSDMLEDDAVIVGWMKSESVDSASPIKEQVREIFDSYSEGTKFEKQDLIRKFRKFLKRQLVNKAAELEKPLALKIALPSRLSEDYVNEKGFPQRIGSGVRNEFTLRSSPALGRFLSIYIPHIGQRIDIPLQQFADIRYLPVTDISIARKLARLLKDRRRFQFNLNFYLQLSRVTKPAEGNRDRLIATGTLDKLEIDLKDTEKDRVRRIYQYDLESSDTNTLADAIPTSDPSKSSRRMEIDRSRYQTPETLVLDRVLALRAVFKRGARLTDAIVLNWMKLDARSGGEIGKIAAGNLANYKQGTSFEKQDIISNFRNRIIAEVRNKRSGLQKDLRINLMADAQIADEFNAKKGFRQRDIEHQDKNKTFRPNRVTEGYIRPLKSLDFKELEYVPILAEAKARKFAKLVKNSRRYRFHRHYYLTLKEVEWGSASPNELAAQVTIDRVELRMSDRQNPERGSLLVHAWTDTTSLIVKKPVQSFEKTVKQRISTLEFAKRAKMKVLNGHLDLDERDQATGSQSNKQNLINFRRLQEDRYAHPFAQNNRSKGFNHLLNIMEFQRDPGLLKSPPARNAAISLYASSRQKAILGERGNQILVSGFGRAEDEFELHEHIKKLRRINIESRIAKLTPEYPVPVVRRTRVQLGEYDFDLQSFPLLFNQSPLSEYQPSMGDFMVDDYLLQKYPSNLELSPENAKKLLEYLGGEDGRQLHLATFINIEEKSFRADNGAIISRYIAVPSRIALFLDADLKQRVREFDISAHSREFSMESLTSASRLQESVRRYQQRFMTVLEKPVVDLPSLALAVNDQLPGEKYLRLFFERSKTYRNAHELENREILEQQISRARNTGFDTREFWMSGWVNLGIYDLEQAGFPIESLDLQPVYTSSDQFDVTFSNDIINASEFAFAKVKKDLARKVLDTLGNTKSSRRFSIRALVEPLDASYENSGNYLETSVSFRLKELFIIKGDEDFPVDERFLVASVFANGS